MGVVKFIISHSNLLAQEGAPESYTPGYKYVHVAWFRTDAEMEIIVGVVEAMTALLINGTIAFVIMEMNYMNNYLYVGVFQLVASLFFFLTQVAKVAYGLYYLEVVLAGYSLRDYVPMKFTGVFEILGSNDMTIWGYIVYFD